MNSPERNEEIADQALRSYFRKEVPQRWPNFAAPVARSRPRSSNRSRWILAAAAALLFIGPWLLSNKFGSPPKPGASSIIDVGQKTKLPDR